MRMIFQLLMLTSSVLLSSCALFQTTSLEDQNVEDLIRSIPAVGEGRGRLGIKQHQYLFSFDALLKENFDWILAANIPLHGEELLVIPNLQEEILKPGQAGLQNRIERGIADYLKSEKQSAALTKTFMLELRSLMRLVLHEKLGEKLDCIKKQQSFECQLATSRYQVIPTANKLLIKKNISAEHEIELIAENLTDSIFNRTSIMVHSQRRSRNAIPLLSLELFWQ
jgi:hypothetical protein